MLCAVLLCASPAFAQDVSLTSRDGAIEIEGTLLSYDGEFYRVDTIYGPLTLDGEGVTCAGPGCPDLDAFIAEATFSGTRFIGDVLLPALIQSFATQNQFSVTREVQDDAHSTFILSDAERVRARFALRSSSTAEGYADLIADAADIAMVLREPNRDELGLAASTSPSPLARNKRARVLALDGLIAMTAPDQPVKSLTLEELSKVFQGEIRSWSDLGGVETEIVALAPPENTGIHEALLSRIITPFGRGSLQAEQSFPDPDDLADAVARDASSIGLGTLSTVGNAVPMRLKGACGFEQEASVTSLRTEDYPLTLPLMLYTPPRRLPLILREFLAFTRSPAADLVIRRTGYVDQAITESAFGELGDRLAHAIANVSAEAPLVELQRLVETLRNRTRLSTTFRFESGVRLDVQSSENIARLAQALETGRFDGRSLVFVGFSDGQGPSGPNKELALRRAALVLDQVREAAGIANFDQIEVAADAFGEVLPMACDDIAWGRSLNRRVEVWIE